MLAEEICDSKQSLATLAEPVMLYPQYTKNIRVKDKPAVLKDEAVLNALKAVEEKIAGNGRALLRQSGTEPVIRVMIESETMDKCVSYADEVVNVIIERGHSVE